jgi:large subunit ribosomal protein L15
VIGQAVKFVKVFKSGDLSRKVSLKGLTVSAGARLVIESVGGNIA